ncbi:glycerol-3-phosphate 1-O-acyltransferase PlsY [Sulfitobacter geojensis]|uniref:Glycerol-3-phosphate acyltransferase n=1 Tax=Sulfitobacter geojensis TaxID=1342299 RepID=A0AAE2W044_9RHOB|nr:glycerol-3-phosphate 1-O-acyltransferase PlsY [Sulfitobacter geojensis]MBM1690281.1 glycerol-3-phosphate 1-O-acyltransferase PlsY [Sulfitobacter geojensis]MBM1694347.1 glycerol-3-phosphate 1-O-acyltransferase PlsY [Sulfitobacter geojensis]MBM1706513.1 glycerol-3-phosphate 1-O-acyltransferase PlsY [Sulfitobacter geojensis]MBM1710571.1 glycerol-3-phosphate 1-O-acyltransferase PlsY [Sulfitobacter geojensis]MBM1714637.1 glycerol-3-phosphate 1-O-acyltransferase PlsY [Sulfitobacter geojensis]
MPPIDSSPVILILWAILGYIAGSIPFGMVLARLMGLGNLRDIGSGNIGATNVLRTGNKKAAALTLLFDAAKGAVVVLLARALAGEAAAQLAALAAMLGHCFPVWLKFNGGKGVATFLGIMLALAWPVGIGCCLAWLVAVAATRVSSMGALAAASVSTMLLVILNFGYMLMLGIALTLLLFVRHRANIHRIKAGNEPKIGQK